MTVVDEANTRVKPDKLLALLRRHGDFGLIALVGVQSNQFPRALDIARPFRSAGIPVIVGGFHVSGCLAMLPTLQPDLQTALDIGVSLFAGEAEGRMDEILRHAASGRLQPIYRYLDELPALESQPTPILPARHIRKTVQHHASFDAGRGCPYQCSFCTIINVQGRKSRSRSADDVERTIREHLAEGIRHFFITDDNFARNKAWEEIFDRVIELRERDKLDFRLIIQVDTLCHKIPNFIEKAARAGVNRVFIGLENINPANLLAAKKRQNKITEYRAMLLAWKDAGVITKAGYILGFPADTPESIREDIEIIKKELPVDILEFFVLTPLPGSEDHKVLWQKGAWMDADMNKYDSEHAVAHHPRMSKEAWEDIYRSAWRAYYTPEHMETVLRRAAAKGCSISRLTGNMFVFANFVDLENTHPLQGGFLRAKVSPRPSSWIADRADLVVLPEIRVGIRLEICPHDAGVAATRAHDSAHPQGPAASVLCRSGPHPGLRGRDRDARIVHAQRRRAACSRACAQDRGADRRPFVTVSLIAEPDGGRRLNGAFVPGPRAGAVARTPAGGRRRRRRSRGA